MKLEGFGLFVKDMGAMVEFYNKHLEFNIKYVKEDKNVYLEKDGTIFLMYGRKDFEDMTKNEFSYPKKVNGTFEIALQASSYSEVDIIFNRLVENGVKAIMKPKTMPWGQRTCFIADPEGNLIEIGSFNKE